MTAGAFVTASPSDWTAALDASTLSSGPNNTFRANTPIWETVRLSQGQQSAPQLGRGVTVAIIDSGIDLNHAAFDGRLSSARQDFLEMDGNPQEGGRPGDMGFGHGTGVADIVLQVAPNAVIMPLRALAPDGTGDTREIAAAVRFAVQHGAQIINASVASEPDADLENALADAAAAGVYVVLSAGNTGTNPVLYPARMARSGNAAAHTLSVGSSNTDGVRSSFSSYGADLEVLAPGEGVVTAYPGNYFATWRGTSFAAPMVSGALALALGEHGDAGINLATRLIDHATNVDTVNTPSLQPGASTLGYGQLNIAGFVDSLK
ncbi:S8 family serine peptidase [Deinococcus aerolatus]|uniref:S8 family serine peptidase n=1 Tax=Deinococcus aerolatus TaxID=522487 RepID=UPI00166A171F|nr:S8 family serine peptidase [Deinococcus aerolatus]